MKAVIIIDMPERCDTCPVRHMGLAYCNVGRFSTSHYSSGKPVDQSKRHPKCPARPLPMKMSAPTYRDYDMRRDALNYYAGWNDCIDRITGKSSEETGVRFYVWKGDGDDEGRSSQKE